MLLLSACAVAMLVPTLLRDPPIYESFESARRPQMNPCRLATNRNNEDVSDARLRS
jgi:hypothetical protein